MDPASVLETVVENVPHAVWVIGRDLSLKHFNSAFADLCFRALGHQPRRGMPLDKLIDPTRQAELHAYWLDMYRRTLSGRSVLADSWFPLAGEKRYFSLSGRPIDIGGSIAGATFSARDLTDASRPQRDDLTELALKRLFESDDPLPKILDAVLELICDSGEWQCAIAWLTDGAQLVPISIRTTASINSLEFASQVSSMRFSFGHGMPGRAWASGDIIWVPDLFEETGMQRGTVAMNAGLHALVAAPLLASGHTAGVIELFARAARPMSPDVRQGLRRMCAALARLIERRRAEDERRALQQAIQRKGLEWELTFDALDLPIFITTVEGTILRINRAARDLVGTSYSEALGHALLEIGPGEPWKTLADAIAAVRDSRTSCTAQTVTDVGTCWDVNASWFFSLTETDARIIVVLRDVSNLVHLQESVRRGEQLAALGELVAGVAHEVRNPLFGMSATLDLLQPYVEESPDAAELCDAMRQWLARLNNLMENLLHYGKTWHMVLQEGMIDGVLKQAVETCTAAAAEAGVVLETDIQPTAPILMDASRLSLVFENLIRNAIQHSHPNDRVRISAAKRRDVVACSVEDNGPGFAPADLPHIFEPFYTKRRGGTGLGLAIAQRIMEEHGGTVAAENRPEGGAAVRIEFPIYDALRSAQNVRRRNESG